MGIHGAGYDVPHSDAQQRRVLWFPHVAGHSQKEPQREDTKTQE
jgi:hypothetical protein